MKARLAFLLAALAGLGLMACATSTGGAGGGGSAEASAPAAEELPQGTEPSDNMHTRSAALYLDRAERQSDPNTKQERYQQALDASIESIRSDGGNPKGYFLAGRAYIGLGDYVGADSMLTKAEEIYPRYRPEETRQIRNQAWIRMYNPGITALQQGNLDRAEELLKKADAIFRGRPEALLNLGQIYAQRGEMQKGIDVYREALDIIRSPAFDRQNERTQEQWRQNERIAAFNLAQLLAQNGEYAEAEEAYRNYIESDPDNVQALTNLAVVLVNQEKSAEAAEIYDRLLAREDLGFQDYFNIGVGLFQTQHFERAITAFRKAAELNPYSRDANYNLLQAMYQLEMFQELVPVAERLLEQDPYNRNAIAMYTQGLLQAGREEEAEEMYEKHENLPFQLTGLTLQAQDGSAQLSGRVENRTAEAGQTLQLHFTFVNTAGEALAEKEVQVELPAQEQAVPFRLTAETEGEVAGYKYEVVEG